MKTVCSILLLAVLLSGADNALLAQAPVPVPSPPSAPAEASSSSGIRQGSGGLLHLPPATDSSAEKAGQLLEQMVAALGGEAYLNIQDIEQEGRTYSFDSHGEPSGAGNLFWRFWKWPDKDRIELTKQRDVIDLFVGNEGYETTFRGTAALEQEQLTDYLRRRDHSLAWVLRKWLHEPGTALFFEGPVLAERKQAQQVSLITAKNDAVSIAIDDITHLPLRVAFTWRDPQYHDHNEDAEAYDNYRPVQGIMTPFSVIRYHNGLPRNQRFISSTKYNQNPPDTLFTATIGAAPAKDKGKRK
jgi:hypothetical protein